LAALIQKFNLFYFKGSYFCSQDCFKGSWELHKGLHKLVKGGASGTCSKPNRSFNPWPGYIFTGKNKNKYERSSLLRPTETSETSTVLSRLLVKTRRLLTSLLRVSVETERCMSRPLPSQTYLHVY
jgi:hypothetical protein